jgi:hypothetical protein
MNLIRKEDDKEIIKDALRLAMYRLSEIKRIDFEDGSTLNDVLVDLLATYPKIATANLYYAIDLGSQGHYGRSFKFCFQEISYWVLQYLKQNNIDKLTGVKVPLS